MSIPRDVLRNSFAEREAPYYTKNDITYPVYTEKTVITVQPSEKSYIGRCPLPISIVDSESIVRHCIPLSGLQLLNGVQKLKIHQTVELNDMLSYVESENRFFVRTEDGSTIFGCLEHSEKWQRMLCSSRRGFNMSLYDRTRQEAMYFQRRLVCSSLFSPCCRQKIEVFIPSDVYIGCVKENLTLLQPSFTIENSRQQSLYYVTCTKRASCCNYKEAIFKITNEIQELGIISHEWNHEMRDFTVSVKFHSLIRDSQHKALLLACAFLIEYMYFETSKSRGLFNCIR